VSLPIWEAFQRLNAHLNSLTEQEKLLWKTQSSLSYPLHSVRHHKKDLRELTMKESFCIVCLWFENFGHNPNPERYLLLFYFVIYLFIHLFWRTDLVHLIGLIRKCSPFVPEYACCLDAQDTRVLYVPLPPWEFTKFLCGSSSLDILKATHKPKAFSNFLYEIAHSSTYWAL
jgi:hypothetical protein